MYYRGVPAAFNLIMSIYSSAGVGGLGLEGDCERQCNGMNCDGNSVGKCHDQRCLQLDNGKSAWRIQWVNATALTQPTPLKSASGQ